MTWHNSGKKAFLFNLVYSFSHTHTVDNYNIEDKVRVVGKKGKRRWSGSVSITILEF